MARVRVVGDQVIKVLDDAGGAGKLLRHTELLRKAGVATPAAHAGDGSGQVRFERIAGRGGLAAILADHDAALRAIIDALSVLQSADLPGLPVFDPMLRIRHRLAGTRAAWMQDWIARYLPPPCGTGLVHGDFHAGQVIEDKGGQVWILDLDDLALGPCEADLGNFAAHLATRPETRLPDLMTGYLVWMDRVLRQRSDACPALADRYGRIALLRRALKLAEKGDDSVLSRLRDI